jgi:nitroimidazol reductase NimA-like FMN-containing flavoprotein (pyridoxamine 5'-phosphate oxidase superfamily)
MARVRPSRSPHRLLVVALSSVERGGTFGPGQSSFVPATLELVALTEDSLESEDGLEVLPEAECRTLLAGARVGRVAVTIRAMPAVFPVNFALLDGDVVFLTAEGTKLRAALERAVVAFEIDEIHDADKTGWSVFVVGHSSVIGHAAELERARALGIRPWAPGLRNHFVRVQTELISGRRINP